MKRRPAASFPTVGAFCPASYFYPLAKAAQPRLKCQPRRSTETAQATVSIFPTFASTSVFAFIPSFAVSALLFLGSVQTPNRYSLFTNKALSIHHRSIKAPPLIHLPQSTYPLGRLRLKQRYHATYSHHGSRRIFALRPCSLPHCSSAGAHFNPHCIEYSRLLFCPIEE